MIRSTTVTREAVTCHLKKIYLRLKNTVTFKSELWVTYVTRNGTSWQIAYEFLLAFHSNHGPILYHLWDKTRLLTALVWGILPYCVQKTTTVGYHKVKRSSICAPQQRLRYAQRHVAKIEQMKYKNKWEMQTPFHTVCSKLHGSQ